jgi:hypothetical protein
MTKDSTPAEGIVTIAEADSAAASSDATALVEALVAVVFDGGVTANVGIEFNDDNVVMAQCPMIVGRRTWPSGRREYACAPGS